MRLIGITVRSVGRSIRPGLMTARRATLAIGAATGIGIRWVIRQATSIIARTMVAMVSRIVFVNIAAAGIAAAARALAAAAARSAVVGLLVTRITTSIRVRRLLRRRIRITRCVVRGISC